MSLQTLEDQIALRQLVCRYGSIVDDADAGQMAGLFIPDGALVVYATGARPGIDQPLRRWSGIAGFAKLIATLGQTYERWVHFVGNHWVELEGDAAWGETYCMASGATRGDAIGPDGVRLGPREEVTIYRYKDSFVRTANGWRFRERLACKQWEIVRPITEAKHALDAVLQGR